MSFTIDSSIFNSDIEGTEDSLMDEIRYEKGRRLVDELLKPEYIILSEDIKKFKNIGYKPNNNEQFKKFISIYASVFPHDDMNWIDTSRITDMRGLFSHSTFDGDISKWDVSSVTDMSYMFAHSLFNGNINDWDVSNVTNMQGMFMFSKLNQKLNDWGKNLDERYKAFMFAGSIYDVEKHK